MAETPSDEPTPPRGPQVPDEETLYRAIPPTTAATWLPGGKPSSAIFHHPKFSADIAGKVTVADLAGRWPEGTVFVAFTSGIARTLGFAAHHEPEHGNDSHANVYCDHPANDRKKKARALAAQCQLIRAPTSDESGGGVTTFTLAD